MSKRKPKELHERAGPKLKLTDEMRRKIIEVAALDGTGEEMACYCDVTKQTIYNWFKLEPELFDHVKRLRARPVLKARQTVVKSLDQPQYAFEYLKRKRRMEFGDNVDHTTRGEQIIITVPQELQNKHDLSSGAEHNSEGRA